MRTSWCLVGVVAALALVPFAPACGSGSGGGGSSGGGGDGTTTTARSHHDAGTRADSGADDAGHADASNPADASVSCPATDAASTMCDTRDGHAYRIVTIGTQTWLAENLAYDAAGSFCITDSTKCAAYGRLYTWSEVMAGAAGTSTAPSGVQGICPSGWHVPSEAEWVALGTAAGTATAGTKLKGTSTMSGTDDYGFTVVGSGYTTGNGNYGYENTNANYWTTTEITATTAWHVYFYQGSATLNTANSDTKDFQYSVRCVKN